MAPKARHAEKPPEPWLLWWMPMVALLAPLIAAAWRGATGDDAFKDALVGLAWPGVPLYFGVLAVLWGGWKIDLE